MADKKLEDIVQKTENECLQYAMDRAKDVSYLTNGGWVRAERQAEEVSRPALMAACLAAGGLEEYKHGLANNKVNANKAKGITP